MGKPTGFMEYQRKTGNTVAPLERIKNFKEFHLQLPKKEQQMQAARCMACGVPFCQAGTMIAGMASGCPLQNLVPEWNDLVYLGNYEQAYRRLTKTNCFPEFTSRVCPALCEAACTCNVNGDPVCTKENERAIIENAWATGLITPQPPKVRTGKRVAVVGSGPSGLAAAMQLNRRGHSVTVFERRDRVGGLLRYGIPNMKLDKSVIDRRVDLMKAEGIEFVTNADIGKDVKADKLLKEFDRVLLCCGAANPRDIKAEGRDAKGIYFAVDFLTSVTKSLLDSNFEDKQYISPKGKDVLVIGGGTMGMLHVMLAHMKGANVILSEPVEERRKKALELGANAVIDPTKVDVAEEVKRLTDGLGAKIVFNTTAIPAIALQALDCTAKCGTMVMFSSLHPNKPVEINLGAIHSTQKNITGAQNGTVKTFWQAVQIMNKGVFDPTPLIEAVYDYNDFDEAMACAMRPDTYKVVLKITD